jgi:cytoplasmic iron level regulating protein YaaA (DUF328/UPF0246 family)
VLIIVPSSEGKRAPASAGDPVELDTLSFLELTPVRRRLTAALVATSGAADGLERLGAGPALAFEVARNRRLLALPARPALEVYSGVLHEALDAATLDGAARDRADRSLVIASALWGLLRPADRIPVYRLGIVARLLDTPRLEACWTPVLPGALAAAAGPAGAILDLRAASYQALGVPAGMGERAVTLRLAPGVAGGNVILKRVRGLAARHLLVSGAEPAGPQELADVLAAHWRVELRAPARAGGPWTLQVDPGA